jgi:O-antigen/teichoic acid export membrane protein
LEDNAERKAPPLKLHVAESSGDEDAVRGVVLAATPSFVFRTQFLALADQAIVSGTSLLSTVVVGRFTAPSQLGIYTIAISILASVLAIQDALILLPYTIRRLHSSRSPAEHAGISLLHSAWLAAAAAVALVISAGVMLVSGAEASLTWLILTLVLTAPFALQREFGRTYAFAHLNVAEALILDGSVAVLQLSILGWLGWSGKMSAVGACAALGVACALTSLVWTYRARSNLTIRMEQVQQATAESWSLGKWLCAGQLAVSIQGYASYWMLPLLIGMTETGVFAACNSIASLASPLLTAFRNTLTPRAVLAFKEGGAVKLGRQAFRDALLLVGAMSPFCLVIFLGGDTLMSVMYHGPEYKGQGHVVTVLSIAVLTAAAGVPASSALASMERPQTIVLATSVGTVVTVAAVWILSVEWGLLGAAYGALIGSVAASVGRWVAFSTLVARSDAKANPEPHQLCVDAHSGSSNLIRILHEFEPTIDARSCFVERLSEGGQAHIFAVRLQGKSSVQAERELVIKLYKPEASPTLAHAEFDALSRLHAVLAGASMNGWEIFVPAPLHICQSPLALVMGRVPGRPLQLCLEAGKDPRHEILETVPRVVVAAAEQYWSTGQIYGELSFNNILCDVTARNLSFVDPGVPSESFCCNEVTKQWYPGSHDLGYLLYSTQARLKHHVANPRAGIREQLFTENVLRAHLESIRSLEAKQSLLIEIRACAREHLKKLQTPWSVHGLWCALIKQVASHRIDAAIDRLEASESVVGSLPRKCAV